MWAIDFSAASDTVDHPILLAVLENSFGVGGNVLIGLLLMLGLGVFKCM